jgi:hypothetical protein
MAVANPRRGRLGLPMVRRTAAGPGAGPVPKPDPAPLLVIDGTESVFGRATLCLSALHVAGAWLDRVRIRVVDIDNDDLLLGLQALEWDRRIAIDRRLAAEDGPDPLAGARLYAGIAFRTADHLRLGPVQAAGIDTLVALQFPSEDWRGHPSICEGDIAFDPVAFAAKLGQRMERWL